MDAMPDCLRFAQDIDWNAPDAITDNGRRVFGVRCRIPLPPMSFSAALVGAVERNADALDLAAMAEDMGPDLRVIDDSGDGVTLDPDATGDPGSDDEVELALVGGVASSTSVDFFGTEMSLRALQGMAIQMIRGIPYLPRHNNGFAGAVEWDSVIGRTVHAEVLPVGSVENAADDAEAQYLLRATTRLYEDEAKAQALLRRIARNEPIGQSIGGWFTELQIVMDDDGDIERVIVLGVELDHLAVTRAPANPDSMGIVDLRGALERSAAEHRAHGAWENLRAGHRVVVSERVGVAIAEMGERQIQADLDAGVLAERHILGVKDNEDGTATLWLQIATEGAGVDEEEGGKDDEDRSVPLDSAATTGDDASTDARRSAPHDSDAPAQPDATPSEEPPMSERDEQEAGTALTLDDIRSALADAVQPISERLDALEAERAAPPEPEPAPEPEPTVDQAVQDAEARATAAEARAVAAEAALQRASQRPMRVGRSVIPSLGSGHQAKTGVEALVAECRTKFPTLAAVATRHIPTVTEVDGPAKVSRSDCERALADMLNAAEADGIITDPNHRATWQ
jgi:hypothetical protein